MCILQPCGAAVERPIIWGVDVLHCNVQPFGTIKPHPDPHHWSVTERTPQQHHDQPHGRPERYAGFLPPVDDPHRQPDADCGESDTNDRQGYGHPAILPAVAWGREGRTMPGSAKLSAPIAISDGSSKLT